MVDALEERARHKRCAIRGWKHRRHHQAVRGPVAIQALSKTAFESRRFILLHIHRVKDDALRWIERCELKHLPILNGPYGNAVIEEEGPRRLRRNLRQLKTRFGKDEDLRVDIDAEVRQQAWEIPPAIRAVVQFHFPAL